MENIKDRLAEFLILHRSKKWIANELGCSAAHLRRFLNQDKPLSNQLLDRLKEVLDREQIKNMVQPLNHEEVAKLRVLAMHSDQLLDLLGIKAENPEITITSIHTHHTLASSPIVSRETVCHRPVVKKPK